jgi:hypothetical protein
MKQHSSRPAPRSSIIERLFADPIWAANYGVTPDERESLSNVAMMGEIASERDVLFLLNQLRRARLRF